MGYILYNKGGNAVITHQFICETTEDLKDLPVCGMGSIALIINPSEVYIRDSKGEWNKVGGN